MADLEAYRFQLEPSSPWATPWHADTIFGGLCWAWVALVGREKFEAQLRRFHEGDPPFVISDCFPGGLLPFPIGARAATSDKKRKALWVSLESFENYASGTAAELVPEDVPWLTYSRVHASLSRETGRSDGDDGQLFEEEMNQFDPAAGQRTLSFYMKGSKEAVDLVAECLRFMASRGFGRKMSTGLGAFRLEGAAERCEWLESRDGANGFMALSHFLPAAADPTEGAWRVHVSHPKFQGDQVEHYLKGAVRFLTPGSVFRTREVKQWYGRALPLRRDGLPLAMQYGFCLAAPVKTA